MKTISLITAVYFLSICGFGQSSRRIDSVMKSYFQPSLPGAVIAIQKNQRIIFKKGYGLSDIPFGRPITAGDNFNIGSLTKQFTAFCVLELSNKGNFSLADSIGKFFNLKPPISGITVGQLLSHNSGIPDHYRFIDTTKVKHATDKDVLAAIQLADTLYFPSGTHYRYSNTAYCLLGMLIEKISGISYPVYLQQNIFGPLGIKNARVFQWGEIIPARVTGYDKSKEGKFIRSDAEESIFFSTEADGGIFISMNNYLKWCSALESGSFSRTPMIQKAWKGQTIVDTASSLWYGDGWFVHEPAGAPKSVYHAGFNGGFRTIVFMIPSQGYCISIFSNRSDIDLEELVSRIDRILDVPDNSFIKSGPFESFNYSWPIFATCKEISSFSTLFRKNLNGSEMALSSLPRKILPLCR